jgi:Skp family chaperone for outer membrane proteins
MNFPVIDVFRKGFSVMKSVVMARSALFVLVLAFVLSAAPAFAQAAAPPAAQPPAQAAPAPQPPAAFPQGAKIALVNLQTIAQLSVDGKTSTAKVQALITKKQAEAAAKAKQLQDNQNKLQQGGALLNETARAQLEKDIERQTVEQQRFEQDAQAEVMELQTQLQGDFQEKLFPILNQMVVEKGLQVLFSAADAGIIAADPGIDLTQEAIKRFDAATAAKAAAPAAAAPTAKPAAPTAKPAAPATPAPKP